MQNIKTLFTAVALLVLFACSPKTETKKQSTPRIEVTTTLPVDIIVLHGASLWGGAI